MKGKKSLGQHWLKSEKALKQIVAAGDITKHDTVLEIGPGEGALTERILCVAGHVVAIEKDRELIPLLEEKFASEIAAKRLSIQAGDILAFDPNTMRAYGTTYKLIANIPYYITGAIIEQFLSAQYQPDTMVLLMQKEVAERIVARDKKGALQGKESVLSIAVKAYGVPSIVAKVPPGAFVPPPTVDSAILKIENISRVFFTGIDEKLFFHVLKAVFGKKRKQIGGSLAEFLQDKEQALFALTQCSIPATARPEDLALADWKRLVEELQKRNGVQ